MTAAPHPARHRRPLLHATSLALLTATLLLAGCQDKPAVPPPLPSPVTPPTTTAPVVPPPAPEPVAVLTQTFAAVQADLALTVRPGARQTFKGIGTSLGNWGGNYQKLAPEQRTLLSQLMWRDTKFTILRLWLNMDDYSPAPGTFSLAHMREQYVDSGVIADARANGMTTLLCAVDHYPPYMVAPGGTNWKGPVIDSELEKFAALVAQAIRQLKDETGLSFDATSLQNEPEFTPDQAARMVKALRAELDTRGLQAVQVIGPGSSSVDDRCFGMVDAIRNDPVAWKALAALETHSYNMAATERAAAYVAAPDGTNLKDYWMTEASDNGTEDPGLTGVPALRGASLAARFLNDMNHRVTHWVHFLGYEDSGNGGDDATRIIPFTVSPFSYEILKKYYYYQQLAQAFDIGAVFRDTESSLDGNMTYTYGRKPRVIAATARNPDGTWSVGIVNFTADSFTGQQGQADEEWNRTQGGHTPATTYHVTLKIDELAGASGNIFHLRRTDDLRVNAAAGTVTMTNGAVTVSINPLELVTLRSQGRP